MKNSIFIRPIYFILINKQIEDQRRWGEMHSTEDVVNIYHVIFL